MMFWLLVNIFVNLLIFTHAPKQNFVPDFYHYLPGRRKLPFSVEQRFLKIYFLPSRKGQGGWGIIMELQKLLKLNLRGSWSQVLINSTIFANFTFLISGLLCHNLASGILKCEGSLTNKIFTKSIVCRNNYMKYTTFPYPIF